MRTCTVGKSSVRNWAKAGDDTGDAELASCPGEEVVDLAAAALRIPAQLRAEELGDPRSDGGGTVLELMHEAHPTGEDVVERHRQLVSSGPRHLDLEVVMIRGKGPELAVRFANDAMLARRSDGRSTRRSDERPKPGIRPDDVVAPQIDVEDVVDRSQ